MHTVAYSFVLTITSSMTLPKDRKKRATRIYCLQHEVHGNAFWTMYVMYQLHPIAQGKTYVVD